MVTYAPERFFDLENWAHPQLFDPRQPVWQVLRQIRIYLRDNLRANLRALVAGGPMLTRTAVLHQGELLWEGIEIIDGDATKGTLRVLHRGVELPGATVLYAGAYLLSPDIFLGEGTVVEPGALIKGPAIFGSHCEIRQGAYIRGDVIVGDRCVVGHATEVKHAILLDDAKAGHFAYIGDSVLGNHTNLGAGTKLANLKIVRRSVRLKVGEETYDTGLRKFGAILGDHTQTGCNAVTNPGTLLGRHCLVCPNVAVRSGYYRDKSVIR